MAISKYISKLNHIEGVIKVVNDVAGAASTTITLNSDLLKGNETLSGTPKVNLSAVEAAIANNGKVTITRGGKVVGLYFENTNQILNVYGADSENNTSDLTVSFTGEGMVIIRLLKLEGFKPNFRPGQGSI
jgi:hypothetical protein